MAQVPPVRRRRVAGAAVRATAVAPRAWRWVSAGRRGFPDFIVLGAQRAGTTSLYQWVTAHDQVTPATSKEVHYFDLNYEKGERWYRSHFPLSRPGRITGEASPYLLYHPLSPRRAGHDLPSSTRFVAVLRHPVQRALSHYWHERRMKAETESLEKALALEGQRLAGEDEAFRRGERSFAHFHYSYEARGRYAEQLSRWFEAVGRHRILVVESEALFVDPDVQAEVARWLGLGAASTPFPALNEAARTEAVPDAVVRSLEARFEAPNEKLFALLGRRLWGR